MSIFWIEFKGRAAACLETPGHETEEEALALAKPHGDAAKAHRLPYPREPRLVPMAPNGCPSFCYGGRECLDKTACPQRRSCTE